MRGERVSRPVVAIVVLCIALMADRARAQESIVLADVGCDAALYRAQALRDLLVIELADQGSILAAYGGATVLLSSAECDAVRGVLGISIVRDGLERRREIVLDGTEPDSRARVAALAIAELVLATRPRATNTDDAARPARAAIASALPAPARDPAASLMSPGEAEVDPWLVQLAASFGGAVLPMVETGLASLRAGVRIAAPRSMPWHFEIAAHGSTGLGRAERGDSRAHALSLALAVLALTRDVPVEIGAGIELDVGAAWVSGHEPSGARRAWVDPTVVLCARGALIGHVLPDVALTIDVRAGWALVGVELRGSEGTLAGIAGAMFALDVGAQIALR